jgi:hypothetical protein
MVVIFWCNSACLNRFYCLTSVIIAQREHVEPVSVLETDQRFGGNYCLCDEEVLMMDTVSTCETAGRFVPDYTTQLPRIQSVFTLAAVKTCILTTLRRFIKVFIGLVRFKCDLYFIRSTSHTFFIAV